MQESSFSPAKAAVSVIESLESRRLLAQTIAVDLNTPIQTIRAIGANVAKGARSTDITGSPRDSTSDYLLQNFDIGMARVAINIKTWEPVNDNSDPNVVRAAGFPDFGYNKKNFELIKELTNRGVPVVASLFDLPNWMVSNPQDLKRREVKPGYELEVAESICWWLKYLKTQYGVKLDLISMNEGNGGYNVRWNQVIFSSWLKKAAPFFAQQGLGYVKFLAGDDGVHNLNALVKPLLENPEVRPYLGPVAYHSWSQKFI